MCIRTLDGEIVTYLLKKVNLILRICNFLPVFPVIYWGIYEFGDLYFASSKIFIVYICTYDIVTNI